MNILIFNTYNPLKDSAVVALDLFNQMKGGGHNVKLLVNRYDKNYPDDIISVESHLASRTREILYKFEWRFRKLKQFLKIKGKYRKNTDYRFFQLDEQKRFYKTERLLKIAGDKPDIILVLFAKGFVNMENISELYEKTSARIFWLMFDMAPFTGGCHYAWDCRGYQESCGTCPGLYSSDPRDISHDNLMYKRACLEKVDIHVLAGSEWQYRQAKVSTIFKDKQIHKFLITIDPAIFKPVDKAKLKAGLKIDERKKIIFFGAVGLTERRKGMSYLFESLNKLKAMISDNGYDFADDILLLIAGGGYEAIVDLLPFESHYMGYLDNNYGIASAYQAADIFLCPSIEDSGPMMINQSVMCGTPVVSFEMGVSLDLVISGETGYRAKIKDSNDMANGIFNILKLNSEDYSKMSENCRNLALKLCSPESRMRLFEDLLRKDDSK